MEEDQLKQQKQQKKRFTLMNMPLRHHSKQAMQLDMFDCTPVEDIDRGQDYISELDATVVDKQSAVMVSLIKITDPNHEILALIAAKAPVVNQYVFKLYSNVKEFEFTPTWSAFTLVAQKIESVARDLKEYDYQYRCEGDS